MASDKGIYLIGILRLPLDAKRDIEARHEYMLSMKLRKEYKATQGYSDNSGNVETESTYR